MRQTLCVQNLSHNYISINIHVRHFIFLARAQCIRMITQQKKQQALIKNSKYMECIRNWPLEDSEIQYMHTHATVYANLT